MNYGRPHLDQEKLRALAVRAMQLYRCRSVWMSLSGRPGRLHFCKIGLVGLNLAFFTLNVAVRVVVGKDVHALDAHLLDEILEDHGLVLCHMILGGVCQMEWGWFNLRFTR